MANFLSKIPVVRTILRQYKTNAFHKQWKRRNTHNDTVIGIKTFPIDVVSVGKASYGQLNVYSLFSQPGEKLHIGNYVSIAPGASFLLGMNHQINTITTFPLRSRLIERSPQDALNKGPLIIEDEVWIGTNAMIFSGITVGKGAIIAAGAIVTKDVPPYAIVGGNPAKLIKYRFSEEIIKMLMPIKLVDLPEEWIKRHIDFFYKPIHSAEDLMQIKTLIESINK